MADDKHSGANDLSLAADFPAASHEQWLKLVDKVLAGAPFEKKLVSRTYDGLALQPLYTRGDWNADGDPSGLPGGVPFTRGGSVLGTSVGGWDLRQRHGHANPAATNAEILEDLERGVTSIVLKIDPNGKNGVLIQSLADLDTAMKGVMLDLAPVVLDIAGPPLPYATLLMALLDQRGVGANFAGNFGFDPLAALATNGKLFALDGVYARLVDSAAHAAKAYPKARTINVNAFVYHSAGAADAQELGCAIATAVEYLRALTAGGLDIDTACRQIAFTTAVDADFFLSIVKIRALRRLWARVTEACGATVRTAPITATSAPRMMSKRDPWVNMLRTTVACFAGGIGGADAVTVLPFDAALGTSGDLGRRIARNTQLVLLEESSLAKVIDPAGGAWMFERLTDEVSEKAWAFFQDIEKQGGMAKALLADFVQKAIGTVRTERSKNIAKRKDAVTGVSEFPNIHEAPVEPVKVSAVVVETKPEGTVPPLPAPGTGAWMSALVKAAAGGANVVAILQAVAQGAPTLSATPLPAVRLAQEFEDLRDAGDAFKTTYGQRPKVFLANIGTVADFTARATFAKNFFEAGGIEAMSGAGGTDVAAIARDFKGSGASFAILCSTDAVYAESAVNVAKALKDAGAAVVYLAGRGGEAEAALRAAGVDEFVFIGCDAKAMLESAHKRLKV